MMALSGAAVGAPDTIRVAIVENARVAGRVKQKVIARLGRLDELLASGDLDRLLASLGRLSEKYVVLGAQARGEAVGTRTRIVGPALIFERLWQELGIDSVIKEAGRGRRFGFELERAVFLSVLHRLFAPGSDRAAEKWKLDYAIGGTEGLELHQLYRTMAWLGEPLQVANDAHPVSLRTRKDRIEEALFDRRRDLFTQLALVFFDHTA